ncbi:MAG: bifunctional glutamate N-acetyltransferase/amino-acid acetyltransferase ArgJ [Gammaproteobacteria bacterium]|nr:MAG: bifunctional glutamate N-acetyltransferase/amino-acid acetyltransferase ArgJ [Gammaproteobacteria bacterium]
MAVNISKLPIMHPIKGFKLGTTKAEIRYPDRRDLVLMEIASGSAVAATFTNNAFCAAPVTVAKKNLAKVEPRYLLVNTGNANAGTGEQGLEIAKKCCEIVADVAGVNSSEVLPFSTGVIGEQLSIDKFELGIPNAYAELSENGWDAAAHGIMTTDTVPKGVSEVIKIGDKDVVITGISKGSGMIKPNMATMLGYIATDAYIDSPLLQKVLSTAVTRTFNRVTVDGDTSTNDALVLVATAQSAAPQIREESEELELFAQAVERVCKVLAQALVRDGEGATKFITIDVQNCKTEEEAEQVAFTIAHSPLVKTALFASDPNWGRILAAVGRSGVEELEIDKVSLFIGATCLIRNGNPDPQYTEQAGQKEMDHDEITITVDLQRGDAAAQVWTCDFSYDYVKINAEYRS